MLWEKNEDKLRDSHLYILPTKKKKKNEMPAPRLPYSRRRRGQYKQIEKFSLSKKKK